MNIKQLKADKRITKKSHGYVVVRNLNKVLERNYITSVIKKQTKTGQGQSEDVQSPTEYAIEKSGNIVQNSTAKMSSGVYRVYKKRTQRIVNEQLQGSNKNEKFINKEKDEMNDILNVSKLGVNEKCIRINSEYVCIQMNHQETIQTKDNKSLQRQFIKLPNKRHAPKPFIINRAETEKINHKESKYVKNVLLYQNVKTAQSNQTYRKPKAAAMQQQVRFNKNQIVHSASYVPTTVQKHILQKKLQYTMIQDVIQKQNIKKFTTVQYIREFVITVFRSVTVTASQFLMLAIGVTFLIGVMFFALFASVVASPFGILFSNEVAAQDTISLSVAAAAVQNDFTGKLEALQTADNYSAVYISGDPANLVDVVAVFAVKTAGTENTASTDVISFDNQKFESLKTVFWDMTEISSHVDTRVIVIDEETSYIEKDLYIDISSRTALEQAQYYQFKKRQMDALYELLSQRFMILVMLKNVGTMDVEAHTIIKNLPEDLSHERESVVRAALSLVGKVNYFWGGKSLTHGWDDNWGFLRKVTAEGNPTTGTYRLYGLDCSGFIDWAFFNASDGEHVISGNGGVASQRQNCIEISWDDAQVGDLVFYADNSHAGILCGRDKNGALQVVHCASGTVNNVVITGIEGFTIVGRPNYFTN